MIMKKNIAIIFLASFLLVFFSACKEEKALFEEGEALVAFNLKTATVTEANGIIEIPVLLVSGLGNAVTVTVEVADTLTGMPMAVEGDDFTVLDNSLSLNFDKGTGEAKVRIQTIDNDVRDKDRFFWLVITANSANFPIGYEGGKSKHACLVKVADNEHPLQLVIGTYLASAESYFNGPEEYTISTEPDPNDETRLLITNLVSGGSNLKVFGIVDLESDPMTIQIPVLQSLVSSATNPAQVYGFYGPDGATTIPEGGFITGEIDAQGNITILDEYGSRIYEGVNAGYWYNIYASGAVWTKQ
jgi:hypothetical protein